MPQGLGGGIPSPLPASASSGVPSNSSAVTSSIAQTAHGFVVGDVLYYNGTAYVKALADSSIDGEVVGIVSSMVDANNFVLLINGAIAGLSGLTAGTTYFLDPAVSGALTATEPIASGQISKPLLVATSTTTGYFINMRGLVLGIPTTQAASTVYAGPTSGAAAAPAFRAIVPLDLATGGTALTFYRGDAIFATPAGAAIGFTVGKDRSRPVAAGANIYLTTDTFQTYASDQTNWYVVGKGTDKCTVGQAGGGFSDTNYFVSPAGAAVGPTMINPYSLVVGFYVNSLPGIAGGIIASYGIGNISSGWIFGNSTVNNNKIRMYMVGLTPLPFELNLTMTVGFHVIALNYNGTSVRYCMDGGAVTGIAATGTFTAPGASAINVVGRYFGATGFSCIWADFAFAQGYASALSDADLQLATGNGAVFQPGILTADPAYDFQTRWMPDGGSASGAVAFQAYGTAKSTTSNLSPQGVGIYKTAR